MNEKYQTVQLPNELFFFRGNTTPTGVRGRLLERVEYPEDGGILTYFEGLKYPFRGFLEVGSIGRANIVKKYVKLPFVMLSSRPLRYFVPIIFILPKSVFNKILSLWVQLLGEFCLETLRVDWYNENMYKLYSEPVNEIMRVLTRTFEAKDQHTSWIILSVCTILEQDKAYRFRLQDVLSQLNLTDFDRNPRKELKRLMKILVERDSARDWKALSGLVSIGLFGVAIFRRDIYKTIIRMIQETNPARYTLRTEDLYHCLTIEGYNFLGKSYEERLELQKSL